VTSRPLNSDELLSNSKITVPSPDTTHSPHPPVAKQ
jgi:hypothetical protein